MILLFSWWKKRKTDVVYKVKITFLTLLNLLYWAVFVLGDKGDVFLRSPPPKENKKSQGRGL